MLGSGAVIVMDRDALHGRSLLRLSYFTTTRNPAVSALPVEKARAGCAHGQSIIEHGEGRMEDLDALNSVADNIQGPHYLRAR